MQEVPGIKIYDKDVERVSTLGFNIDDIPSDKVVQYLDQNGIAVRGGIHCAILAHEALGTVKRGVVRVSLSPFNKEEEIKDFIRIIRKARESICI